MQHTEPQKVKILGKESFGNQEERVYWWVHWQKNS